MLEVRLPHALELLADSFAQAFFYALLLFTPVAARRAGALAEPAAGPAGQLPV